jgi:uncharacterized protein YhaN
LEEELDMVSEQLSEARMTLASLETRLERMPREDRLQQIVEEMDRLTARRDALASYGEALGVALGELRAAAGQLQQGVSPRLHGLAGGIHSDITNGRYPRLGTDDQLAVHVEVPETPEAPVVAALSGGTSDQVWLSVRLAAAQMLEPGKEPLPLSWTSRSHNMIRPGRGLPSSGFGRSRNPGRCSCSHAGKVTDNWSPRCLAATDTNRCTSMKCRR